MSSFGDKCWRKGFPSWERTILKRKSPIARESGPRGRRMRTYIDSGVLITAARGTATLTAPAIEILTDVTREFVSSDWVRLEVLPKARFFNRESEIEFYDLFFTRVSIWVTFEKDLLTRAMEEAIQSGLSAVEANPRIFGSRAGWEGMVTPEK